MRDIINKLWTGNKKVENEASSSPSEPEKELLQQIGEPPDEMADETIETAVGLQAVAVDEGHSQPELATESSDDTLPDIPVIADVNGDEADDETEPIMALPISLETASLKTASLSETLISKSRAVNEDLVEPLIRAAQRCHVGLLRSRNEDSCYMFSTSTGGNETLLPFGLYVVADGMGGHFAGHEASKLASRMVAEQVLTAIYLPLLKGDNQSNAGPKEPIQEVMLRAVQEANLALYNPDPEKDSGTTLTAVLIFGRRLYLAHVGDSRAYMLSNGTLELLTIDHSYVQRLQTVGQLTAEEAASHPHRNVLYRAVGQGAELEIDTFTRSLSKSGKLVLCSDGMWGLVPEPIMQDILEQDISLQAMADKFVELALQAGGHDNITAVVVDFAL